MITTQMKIVQLLEELAKEGKPAWEELGDELCKSSDIDEIVIQLMAVLEDIA